MILVKTLKKDNNLEKITITGHADYQEYGKDIVCAAVSATYLCTVNGIFNLNKDSIDVISNKDLQKIIVLKKDNVTISLLENMINCLESLQEQYPKNINLDKEEK